MTSIQNARWVVTIHKPPTGMMGYCWCAWTKNDVGVWAGLAQAGYSNTDKLSRSNWLKFAKLNKIKYWRWAE